MIFRSIRVMAIASLWTAVWPCFTPTAAAQDVHSRRPAITDGLVHYWPNLWDAHDEVTGRDGVVMGILPAVEDGVPDETPFNDETGWVQLPVDLDGNSPWTLAVWIHPETPLRSDGVALGLHGHLRHGWLLTSDPGDPMGYQWVARGLVPGEGPGLMLRRDAWHHIVVAKSAKGYLTVWRDGLPQGGQLLPSSLGFDVSWITAGNDVKGDVQWFGQLQDLSVYDRVLSEPEIHALHLAGRSVHAAALTTARQAALRTPTPVIWSTNVTHRSIDEFAYRRYTAEDGLPANNVGCLIQTRDRYLWVGTEAGIARFDGRQFRNFTADNTPALEQVGVDTRCLVETADGALWAGVFGGVLRIRGLEVTGFTNGLSEGYVLQAAPAAKDALWIAGFRTDRWYRGPCWVRRWHPETGQSTASVMVPGHVRRLVPTEGGLWMATEDPCQLLFWDLTSPTATVVAKLSGPPLVLGVRSAPVATGEMRVRGWQSPDDPSRVTVELALIPDGPVFHWLSPTRRAPASASRWVLISNPESWLGAQPGLARVTGNELERILFPNRTLEAACVAPNREGGIWLGTASDGLHLVQERPVRVHTTRDGLSNNDVRSVLATPEGTVLAGGEGGVDEFKEGRWSVRGWDSPVPSMGRVLTVARDRFDGVWAGLSQQGWGALKHIHGDRPHVLDLPGLSWMHPNSLAVNHQGRLWAACNYGITWLDLPGPMPSDEAAQPAWLSQIRYGRVPVGEQLPDVKFLKILPAADDSVWVGTTGRGLLHIGEDRIGRFTVADGLPNDTLVPAHLDSSGSLWIVSNGAITRRQADRFQTIKHQQGIPKDELLDLIEDDVGYFWLPGLRGIHRLARNQLEACLEGKLDRVSSLTLGVRDGLLTPDCTSLHYPVTAKTPDGQIWVATRNGVASFDPSRVHIDNEPLTAAIEEIIVNHQPVKRHLASGALEMLKLRPGSGDHLEFHYTATSLVAADRVRFQHWLEGYDSDWSPESDLRLAFYTNLRPGRYQFHVKASNAYGTWNDVATTLPFVIAPHFWQTWLFQGSMGLLVLTLAILLHRQRLGVLRYLHELKTHQQLAAERTRIAADMHDDLGAALSHIAILSEVAKSQSPAQPQTRSALDRISQSARDVTARMSDLVWATNPRNDTLDNLAAYLREQVARQLENTPVRGILHFPERLPQCHVSATFRRNILLVVKETLNNSMKHAAATEFLIKLGMESGHLLLGMEDNGRGFDPATRSAVGNGLTNLRRRIQDLGGTLNIETAPGAGTKVHLRVPLPLDLPRVQ